MEFQFPVDVRHLGPAGPQTLEPALVLGHIRDEVLNHFEDLEIPSAGRLDKSQLALPKSRLDLHGSISRLPPAAIALATSFSKSSLLYTR